MTLWRMMMYEKRLCDGIRYTGDEKEGLSWCRCMEERILQMSVSKCDLCKPDWNTLSEEY